MAMPVREILVLGGGIAGISSALALSKELSPIVPDVQITVFEKHDVPSTSGGAINLTPVAQRHLAHLGILDELDKMGPDSGTEVDAIEIFSIRTGRALGAVNFADKNGHGYKGFKGRRVSRIALLLAMIATVEKVGNIRMAFGKRVVGGEERDNKVIIHFGDGSIASGDLALGCDGVHSPTRTRIVDIGRRSEYTGISFLQTTVRAADVESHIHFRTTALNISRYGSMMLSYFDQEREELFAAAIIEYDEALVRQNRLLYGQEWRAQHAIKMAFREEVHDRFSKSAFACIREIVNLPADWFLYPVYQVPPGGKWYSERVLLLGDAAHAMPPRDESAAYALDDAILFARTLARYPYRPPSVSFRIYEDLRRDLVNQAFKASTKRWDKNRDAGALKASLTEWTMPLYLRRNREARKEAWEFDASEVPIPQISEEHLIFDWASGMDSSEFEREL